jgi:hypothetical protein
VSGACLVENLVEFRLCLALGLFSNLLTYLVDRLTVRK